MISDKHSYPQCNSESIMDKGQNTIKFEQKDYKV